MRPLGWLLAAVLAFGCSNSVAKGEEVQLLDDFVQRSEILPDESVNVLRMSIDLNGDGNRELLLAKSSNVSRSAQQEWFVYTPAGDLQYRFVGVLEFSFLLFRVNEQKRVVLYDNDLGSTLEYSMAADGFHEEARVPTANVDAESTLFKNWRTDTSLVVLSADLNDLDTATNPVWRDLLTNEPVPGIGRLSGTVVGQ
jgi:hypothetical protein